MSMMCGQTLPPKPLIYDLHSHTIHSDGYLTTEQLVNRAVEVGVNVLAITDHDTVTALQEAEQIIKQQILPLTLINGIEISTVWQGFDIHIVGLKFDYAHKQIVNLISQQQQSRIMRAEEIAKRLEKKGIFGALDGAKQFAGCGQITRAHFARYLVRIGKAKTQAQVFNYFLAKGKIGYVPPMWCDISQAIETIHAAGGQAVLAHPDRYKLSAKWLRRLITDFASLGGDGIEVASCRQAPDRRQQLARYAHEYHLLASQGSDFHKIEPWVNLGLGLHLPKDIKPIWFDWY